MGVDDPSPVVDAVGVRDRLAAECLDFLDHALCDPGVCASAVRGSTEVIDDHFCTAPRELERVRAAEAFLTCASKRRSNSLDRE